MTDKIFKETREKLRELEIEVEKKKKEFWKKFKDLEKKKIDVDNELLKDFLEEYWFINKRGEDEYEVIVPRWLNFSVGWLDRTTKGYNVFVINKYTKWLGQIPDFLLKELEIEEAEKIQFDGENIIFEKGKEKYIKEKFDSLLSSISEGSARVKKGKEFDLIASIIDSGSLPFIPNPVDENDLRDTQLKFDFKGKYDFQKHAYKEFLNYGAIGVYWMPGGGKSFLTMYIFDSLKGNKFIVVPTKTLIEQWKEYFKKYAPRLVSEVDLITYQSYNKIKDKDYVIGAFDECHMLPANTFSRFATARTKYRLGLSATPYREDKRTDYIFALTGYPVGLDWNSLMKILGKKYHDVNVYIVKNRENKIKLISNLLHKDKKTIIFVNELEIGHNIANSLGVPFIHGKTKDRMNIARESKVFVASRVMELGISLKDLGHIIEVDFLFGSRREEVQRTGRLFHSEVAEKHDIVFTKEEFESYGKRLHGLIEKGFRINLKPMVTGEFRLIKREVRKTKIKSLTSQGADIVETLFEDGYFMKERTFQEIKDELSKRGIPVSSKHHTRAIRSKLKSLVRNKKTYKIKKGGKNFYVQR